LPVLPSPIIASAEVVWLLLKSFACTLVSCSSRPTKASICEKEIIDGTLPAASTLATSLLNALSFPSLYVVDMEMLRSLSRQYIMSSSSVVTQVLACRLCLDVLNWSKGQLRIAASGIPVIFCSN
jgi:hypothetical protein